MRFEISSSSLDVMPIPMQHTNQNIAVPMMGDNTQTILCPPLKMKSTQETIIDIKNNTLIADIALFVLIRVQTAWGVLWYFHPTSP